MGAIYWPRSQGQWGAEPRTQSGCVGHHSRAPSAPAPSHLPAHSTRHAPERLHITVPFGNDLQSSLKHAYICCLRPP